MRSFNVSIAGRIIGINAISMRVYNICKDFIVDEGESDFTVQCTIEDFDRAVDQFEAEHHCCAPRAVYLEEFSVLEKVADGLIEYGAFLMHGAVLAVADKGIIFTAKSGTGKTTHILKWLDNCSNAYILNGDKPFILAENGNGCPKVCGSPWKGKEEFGANKIVPLKAIVLMERAENNSIQKISFSEAFLFLYQQIYCPKDSEKMRKTLRLLQSLDGKVSFYRFSFNNFKEDCFKTVYDSVVGYSSI